MSRRYSELVPPALVAGCAAFVLGAMGLLTPAFTDYELEAEPSLHALGAGDWIAFLQHAPAYGGSLVLRTPFALLSGLWGGGDLALFRSMAAPCLLAGVVLAVVLWHRGRDLRRSRVTCWLALLLVAANPLTLRALEIGHPEELLGAVLCVAAALAAGRGRPGCRRGPARARDRQQALGPACGGPGASRSSKPPASGSLPPPRQPPRS